MSKVRTTEKCQTEGHKWNAKTNGAGISTCQRACDYYNPYWGCGEKFYNENGEFVFEFCDCDDEETETEGA